MNPYALARAVLPVVFLALLAAGCAPPESADAGSPAPSVEYIDPDPFILGFLPSQRASEIMPSAERLAEFLSERMGRKVEVQVPSAYEPLIEGFRFGHIHAAFLDGGPAWIAHKRTGAEVVLAEMKEGSPFYYAEAFVLTDSPIQLLADLKGRRAAFTSRTGSSGFLMPIGSMIEEGLIQPQGEELVDLENALTEFFRSTIDAGGYQQALAALLDGRVDVAFGAHDAPSRFLTPEQAARLRPLHRFGRIPSHAILVTGNLSPDLVRSFTAAMLALNEPENVHILEELYGVDGLVRASTEDHLGDFGRALSALPGMHRTLLEKKD